MTQPFRRRDVHCLSFCAAQPEISKFPSAILPVATNDGLRTKRWSV